MILYKTVYVFGSANVEVFKDLITSTEVEPIHVRKLYVYETTSPRQGNGELRLYIEREKIAEIPLSNFLDNLTNKNYVSQPVYEIDVDVPIGETLIAGLVSGSTATNIVITIEYEIVGTRR